MAEATLPLPLKLSSQISCKDMQNWFHQSGGDIFKFDNYKRQIISDHSRDR
jgi:hypothetical protein